MTGVKEIDPTSFVTDIVKSDYRTADVFRRYGIDYCCGGKWPLEVACKAQGVDINVVREELERSSRNIAISGIVDFNDWDVDFLVNYIVNIHHYYLNKALPDIKKMMRVFIEDHIRQYSYLAELEKHFLQLFQGLQPHMKHEEEIIFPYIRQIAHAYKNQESYARLLVRTLRKPVQEIMIKEHERVLNILKKMRQLTENYSFDEKSCVSHRVLFLKLKELDNDLQQHIYLEKYILFPKAITMEKELLGNFG